MADGAGDILLIRRTDNGSLALPGGAIDLGESVVQAAPRETLEETGIECAITGIVGIYSDPKHHADTDADAEARGPTRSSADPGSARARPTRGHFATTGMSWR
jgi:ADP-ribose pyrophosphatase YjhB (NUDIX family)